MKFDNYNIYEGIKKSIAKLDYKKPTDIQYKAIPNILKGEDVLAIAQTGTGKTAAFAIPILHILQMKKIKDRPDGVKCLIMAPTHELAQQINEVFKSLGKHTRVTSFCVHGGVERAEQVEHLNQGIDVLIATPGRLADLVKRRQLDLHRVEILVLDEADHMLDLGFIDDMRHLMRFLPKRRQTLFFSATINETIKDLAFSLVHNAIRIQISPKDPVAKNIQHGVSFVEMDDKRFFLENVIKTNIEKKILVFVRTKVRAERVKKAMERCELVTDTIHSDKLQAERESTMKSFRSGDLKVLIATDVSARGIDIPNVELVINYDLPDTAENYVHRVGRTGRGSQKGQAVSFCSQEENDLLKEIEDNLGKPIKVLELSKSDYQQVIDLSEEVSTDWKSLIKEHELSKKSKKRKKK
ncbi:DEAD/DEAH box helicase [Fulvivirga lutimaris]|uniref:DEAD/DEAH box helicase n=1 Tax=Fulvivirga lutimaris TaxID=1819566 RepID=UPI0012BBDB06|nr:DEAD/DEAH box helicase [Fulvivirga lutimaris]MTI38823.1 DEAD/DEAH box helicase [Fulvivirga lutimaris]